MRALPGLVFALVGLAVLVVWPAGARAERRVALVIGNSGYQQTSALPNPRNDATDVADTLKRLGFEVFLKLDADKQGTDHALDDFERSMQGADSVLFYYAGHALQHDGENYLMPVDARLEDRFSLKRELIKVADVRDALGSCGTCVRIMILDSCRNNPLAARLDAGRDVGGGTRGLASFEKPQGLIVAFATQAGHVAQDGDGRNSPFTRALLGEMLKPEVEIAELFRSVALDVRTDTKGAQEPEISLSGVPRYFLNQNEGDATAFERLDFADREQLQRFVTTFPGSAKRPFVERVLKLLDEKGVPPTGETAGKVGPAAPTLDATVAKAAEPKATEAASVCDRERPQFDALRARRMKLADARSGLVAAPRTLSAAQRADDSEGRRTLSADLQHFGDGLGCADLRPLVAEETKLLASFPALAEPVVAAPSPTPEPGKKAVISKPRPRPVVLARPKPKPHIIARRPRTDPPELSPVPYDTGSSGGGGY